MESLKSFLSKGDNSSYQKLPKNKQKKIIKEACQQESYDTKSKQSKTVSDHNHHHHDEERELRMRMVAKRLKEMEMADKSNVHHLLDIEEAFHYYSRLTCPAYLDIVDRFFVELQAELRSL